jgi:hypothetical protein
VATCASSGNKTMSPQTAKRITERRRSKLLGFRWTNAGSASYNAADSPEASLPCSQNPANGG